MSRYIDAEKLTDSIFDWDMTMEDLYYSLCKLVDDVPTADVQEVKHGKWIFHERTKLVPTNKLGIKEEYTNGHSCAIVDDKSVNQKIMIMMKRITLKIPVCSVCGWCGYDEYNATNYCPNCGAKCDI
jgi:predicted Zn-ribbon and HTH transcriptional regulator